MNLLSIDLNTVRLSNQSYLNLLGSINCEQMEIHIYNYIEQKHGKLPFCHGEILHKYLGSRKKIALDIKQALDIVEQCAKTNFHTVYILCGEYEGEFLFKKLDEMDIDYRKISQSDFRQADIIISDFEKNEQNAIKNRAQVATYRNVQNTTASKEQKVVLKDKKSSIIPFDIDDGGTEQPANSKANLSPEQIKKIYNYIKYKQMQSKLKSI